LEVVVGKDHVDNILQLKLADIVVQRRVAGDRPTATAAGQIVGSQLGPGRRPFHSCRLPLRQILVVDQYPQLLSLRNRLYEGQQQVPLQRRDVARATIILAALYQPGDPQLDRVRLLGQQP